jgi:AmmeMemoRadiSam system protein A
MVAALFLCGLAHSGCSQTRDEEKQTDAGAGSEAVSEKEAVSKKEADEVKEHKSGDWSPELSEEEKKTLFAIAKDTLELTVKGKNRAFSFDKYTITPKLKEDCATFVTYKNKGRLRGCIGCLEATEPMYESVHRYAGFAAKDSRMLRMNDPITVEELPSIDIHVSLLSSRSAIDSIDEFIIGAHGICIEKAGRGAVYLPEVAVEQNWTKEETLRSLSMKAGLAPDAWQSGAKFKVFSSVVLSE